MDLNAMVNNLPRAEETDTATATEVKLTRHQQKQRWEQVTAKPSHARYTQEPPAEREDKKGHTETTTGFRPATGSQREPM